jgi:hypothetical protein
MIDDWELWACANTVLAHHGEDAGAFVASRISALSAAEDEAGVVTWRLIEGKIAQLTRGERPLN